MKSTDSKFYQRLNQAGSAELVTLVDKVWALVAALTTEVSRDFRAYTFHDMTHLGNVIGIMEELIPEDAWEKPWKKPNDPLGPMQCALCLLAALVHDLGMAPAQKLREKLAQAEDLDTPIPPDADREFIAYRRHYASQDDHVRAIRTMLAEKSPDTAAIEARKHAIRTEYLRLTHADDTITGVSRIRDWLKHFETREKINFCYKGWPFLDLLERVAISHAHPHGLEVLTNNEKYTDLGSEQVCGLHAAWLLRLSDILDLDASRASALLYRNFPPDNTTSRKHWLQHLCISRRVINWNASPPTVKFLKSTTPCQNPEILHSLREYCGWIRDEVAKVEASRITHLVPAAFPIRLPGTGESDICLDPALTVAGGWESAAIRFQLSQHEVVKILMGEELYGDSSLCLREVIQNSLDATHLRWMRFLLREKMGEARYAANQLPPVDPILHKEDLKISVSWGEDELPADGWHDDQTAPDRRHWIEIADLGTGMTHEVIMRYFTQIGKSYYQSAEYRRERALMREFGLPVSEISQFGIGILSCFMLADMVEVFTCPVGGMEPARQYRIWSSEGLFWHQEFKTMTAPGTRVRMWLKKDRTVVCCETNLARDLWSYHFRDHRRPPANRIGYTPQIETYTSYSGGIDPLRAIWSCTAWPRYPIQFTHHPEWTLDDSAVLSKLLPIFPKEVEEQFTTLMGESPPKPIKPAWRWWDWEHGDTASRIRIAIPVPNAGIGGPAGSLEALLRPLLEAEGMPDGVSSTLWPSIVENALPGDRRSRSSYLVRGMRVERVDLLFVWSREVRHSVGSLILTDLSGHAAPRLRADRKEITGSQRNDWLMELEKVFAAWRKQAFEAVDKPSLAHLASSIFTANNRIEFSEMSVAWPTGEAIRWQLSDTSIQRVNHLTQLLLQYFSVNSTDSDSNFRVKNPHSRGLDRFNYSTNFIIPLDMALASCGGDVEFHLLSRAEDLARDLARDRACDVNYNFDYKHASDLYFVHNSPVPKWKDIEMKGVYEKVVICWSWLCGSNLGVEAFGPSLEQALPLLRLPVATGCGSEARMVAPAALEFNLVPGRAGDLPTVASYPEGWVAPPPILARMGYDLVAPFTNLPIGNLRTTCLQWRAKRALRPIFMLPFIYSGSLRWRWFRKRLQELEANDQVDLRALDSLLMLIPDEDLLEVPFADWTEDMMASQTCTAFWQLDRDEVLWAPGCHNRESMHQHGRTLEDWAGINTQ